MFGGKYRCFSLDAFIGKNLEIDADPEEFKSFWGKEYITSKIWVPPGDYQFPLKEEYERVNYTLKWRSDTKCREIPHPEFDFSVEQSLLPPTLDEEDLAFDDDVQPATPPEHEDEPEFNLDELAAVPQTPRAEPDKTTSGVLLEGEKLSMSTLKQLLRGETL